MLAGPLERTGYQGLWVRAHPRVWAPSHHPGRAHGRQRVRFPHEVSVVSQISTGANVKLLERPKVFLHCSNDDEKRLEVTCTGVGAWWSKGTSKFLMHYLISTCIVLYNCRAGEPNILFLSSLKLRKINESIAPRGSQTRDGPYINKSNPSTTMVPIRRAYFPIRRSLAPVDNG